MKNFIFIRVHAGYKKDADGHLLPVYKVVKYTCRHALRYDNHSHLVAKLTPLATLLLNYLVDHSDYFDNTVFNTVYKRSEFLAFIKKNCSATYTDDATKKAYSCLVKAGFLLKFKAKSVYCINPKYYYRAGEDHRRKLLQSLCSYAAKEKGSHGQQLRKALGI